VTDQAEATAPPRVVFDCGVFLQAVLRETSPAGACIDLVDTGAVDLVISQPVFAEIQDVLQRPELKPRRRGRLTDAMVQEILDWIHDHAVWIEDVPQAFHYQRDPDDEPYLNLAIAAGASYLVSRDKDLLDLEPSSSQPGEALRHLLPALVIVDPVEFLRRFSAAEDHGG
jgi:putative PIN family toxin of toxin-antitoxin system